MKILDTNGLDYMVKSAMTAKGLLHITPDIREEYETWHETPLPHNVVDVFDEKWFDPAAYLQSYQLMLNKHGGRSFYNMSGFGDISILALLRTRQLASGGILPGMLEEVEIITTDGPLTNKIRSAFCSGTDAFGTTLKITKTEDFFG